MTECNCKRLEGELARVRELAEKWRASIPKTATHGERSAWHQAVNELEAALTPAAAPEGAGGGLPEGLTPLFLMSCAAALEMPDVGVEKKQALIDKLLKFADEITSPEIKRHLPEMQRLVESVTAPHPAQEADAPASEQLPLMARREWMRPDACYYHRYGDKWEAHARFSFLANEAFRIATHDAHGNPVVERTADMPEGAKYRVRFRNTDGFGRWRYPQAYRAQFGGEWQRIEDFNADKQEGV